MESETQDLRGEALPEDGRSQMAMPLSFKSGERMKNLLFSILANSKSHHPMPGLGFIPPWQVLMPSVDLVYLWTLGTVDVTTGFCIHSVIGL